MKKSIRTLLIAFTFFTINNTSFSMEAAPAIAGVIDAAAEGKHDPMGLENFKLFPTSFWLSGVGACVSCLGALLMYQGAVKRAQPSAQDKGDLSLAPEPSVEGNQLLASGSLFLFAGLLTILLSPKAN